MQAQTVNYQDIFYQVNYSWLNTEDFIGLDFVVHKILSMKTNDEGREIPAEVEDEVIMKGNIKFDGCMNVQFENDFDHFCGRVQANNFAALFNKIYDKAVEVGCDEN